MTQHRTSEGWFYLAVVLDCFTARIVGWTAVGSRPTTSAPSSSYDPLRRAIWNRWPAPGAIHHSDQGSTYTSWAFGQRPREAGLLGSMGSIGDCFDNSVAENFLATLQTELPDRSSWPTREGLSQAVLAFIEGFYTRTVRAGRHSIAP
jgi:putative transposase